MATVTRFPASGPDPSGGHGPSGSPLDEQAFGPRRLLDILFRRKIMIGGIMALGLGLSVLWVNQLTPLYSGYVTLLIEGARQNVVNIETVAKGLTPDFYTNETQAAVLKSRDLAGKVVDKLDLINNPEFNPELAPVTASTWDVVSTVVFGWFGMESDSTSSAPKIDPWAGYTAAEKRAEQRDYLIDYFLDGLVVIPSQRALLIDIEYVSSSPGMAAKAANAVAEVYIADQLQNKGSVTKKATRWLEKRASELRINVIDAEKKLVAFRRASGIMELQGSNLLREQVAKINTDLVSARTLRSESSARYRQVQTLLKNNNDIETAAAVLESPLIQRLREQEAVVLRKLAELRTQLRDAHPTMVLVRSELADLQRNIGLEVNRIVINLGNELQIARVREQNLAKELTRVEEKIIKQNAAAVTLRSLQTEVQANKQLYETIISRFKETDVVDQELQQADAKIISRAIASAFPFYPQKSIMYAVALFFSALFGVMLAIFLEFLDRGFRTPQQLEDMIGLPVLSVLPKLSGRDRRLSPHEVVCTRPNSMFGEAIRSVRTSLMLTGAEETPKTVMALSSVPGEGKTSLTLSLATLSAGAGQRAIAIDCDLRRASLHKTLGVPNGAGLSDYLSGQAELEEVVDFDPTTGIHYITAGVRVPHPTDLLGSQKMYALLNLLSSSYDIIILDAPPLLAVSDALVLVRAVDRVLFLVRWEKTPRESVVAVVRQITEAGGHLAGLVMNYVDVRKQGRYGYSGRGGYYYGGGSSYYTD